MDPALASFRVERLLVVPVSELKARGRWASDKSLAADIVVSVTMLLQQRIHTLACRDGWLLDESMPRLRGGKSTRVAEKHVAPWLLDIGCSGMPPRPRPPSPERSRGAEMGVGSI